MRKKMAGRYQHNPPDAESFHQFSKLMDEIRLMIWEHTWPGPRMIEAALFENPEWEEFNPDKPIEVVNLRLAGSLSTLLKQDLGSRIVEQGPAEQCPAPVALQVCHQSRMHTLYRYRAMKSLAGSFYYNPERDIMFFSVDVADDYPEHMPILELHHKTELNALEKVLVLESEWPENPRKKEDGPRGLDYTLDCLSHLGALRTIQVLWSGSEGGSEDSMELSEVEGEEQKEEGPQAFADRLRSSFLDVIKDEKCTAKKLEVIDSKGNLY